jgi:mxaK protein
MALSTPGRTRAAWLLLALTLGVAAAAAWSWQRKSGDNAIIAAGQASRRFPADAPLQPALRFAQAHELAASGSLEPALARYRGLNAEPEFGTAARYNSANLLLRQAIELRGQSARSAAAIGQSIALIELAKQSYREVLRAAPDHWEARYNLERALRLQPDPEDSDPSIAEPRNDAERAATKSRGIEAGLP